MPLIALEPPSVRPCGKAMPVRSMPGPWSTMRVMDAPADDAFRAAAKETGVSWKSAWLNPRILSTADSI
jgi:hypothetical protein